MPPAPRNFWAWAIVVLAAIGFVDAAYLSVRHFLGGPVPCFITTGCETVTTSVYSTIGPVPVALLGALFYLMLIVLAILFLEHEQIWARQAIFWLAIAGVLESAYFFYLQAFVLHSYCIYCLISAAITVLLLAVAIKARASS